MNHVQQGNRDLERFESNPATPVFSRSSDSVFSAAMLTVLNIMIPTEINKGAFAENF